MKRNGIVLSLAVLAALGFDRSDVSAQMHSGAIALIIDPSVRAGGMGGASNAVCWGDDPNYWANPALLSYHHGIRFEQGRTQLVPDIFDDVFFTTDRISLGAWGLGVSIVGDPFRALGKMKLDYGVIPIVKDGPGGETQIGAYSPSEVVRSLSIGAGLLKLGDRLIDALSYDELGLTRFAEISIGYTRKNYRADLLPAIPELGLEEAKAMATTYDRGIVFRLTPYNSLDYGGFLPKLDSVLDPIAEGIRVDVGFGSSLQNYNNVALDLVEGYESIRVSKVARDGWAVHVASGMPSVLRRFLEDNGLGVLAESLTPFLSWGKAWDRLNPITLKPGGDEMFAEREIELSGWELDVAGVFSVRRGKVDSPDEQIHGDTSGWSVGFGLADIAGFRYDHATVPQGVGLGPVEREAYAVYFDPLALWRRHN